MSQTALARQVGVTQGAVAQWENSNGTTPSMHHLKSIASVTLANFHWLATGIGNDNVATEAVAVRLSTFAQDDAEEALLECFRALSPHIKDLLGELIRALKPKDSAAHRKARRRRDR